MDRNTLIQTLYENMSTLKRGMHSHFQAADYGVPISRSQIELLFTIRQTQPVSSKLLAQKLCLTPGAVSQLAEGLENQQLITRRADTRDRRIQCLEVSAKGNELLQKVEARWRSAMEAIVADLSDEELEIWLRVQQKMLKHFQADNQEASKQESK
jgi:DNA-binding MarR family transcriptional regulator